MTATDFRAPSSAAATRWTEIDCPSQLFEQTCRSRPDAVAVVCGSEQLTYLELDRRANRLARLLLRRNAGPGPRVGILLERSLDTYVAVLAALKAGASYVPIDPSAPADRVGFIAADSGLDELVISSAMRDRTVGIPCSVLELDRAAAALAAEPATRPPQIADPMSLCYVIYTSGTTGRPKGVAVLRASIVNFLQVAAPIYDVRGDDRVYQGMTLAFDFSFEEIWPTWMAGATLVAGPTDSRRLGHGLTEFLIRERISVLCCVPTLLATVDADVPTLRTLLVGGEACPADLVRRWARPERRMLNTYGPTETTVTATWCELHPGRPVTIGSPLPTYHVYVLDEKLGEVGEGEPGEICIGGPGVAIGYLNRPELTADRFVDNPVVDHVAWAPRLYRTGDLGRVTPGGEIEYLGRIDTQVKIRGYRIELGEIEAVIREDAAVENAVVVPLGTEGVVEELAAYVTLRGGRHALSADALRDRVHVSLRERLPVYMIPAFVEVLDDFPLLAAGKVDRAALPAPASARLGARSTEHVSAHSPLESRLAAVWAQVLGRETVSVEDDFFTDLGGHSLLAACVVSQLRRVPPMETLAIGDLYAHPTIRGLAYFIAREQESAPDDESPAVPPLRHSSRRVLGCGLAQLGILYSWMQLLSLPLTALLYAADRSNGITAALAAGAILWIVTTAFVLPIAGSRLLLHGVRPGRYRLWGRTYLRWWLHGKFIALSPIALLAGSPLLSPYLRLIGARIGRDCHLGTGSHIGTPSLVSIGDGASIGYGVHVLPSVVEGGWLHLAPVRIGAGCFVGTNSVVLAGAQIGDESSIGEQSLVPAGCAIPAGEHWSGSPIERRPTTPELLRDIDAFADGRRWPVQLLAGYALGAVALMLLPWLIMAPSIVLVGAVTMEAGLRWGMLSTLAAGPLVVVTTVAIVVAGKRAVMPDAWAGIHRERTGFGLRKWLSDHLIGQLQLIRTIYDTLYLKPVLRLLGARIGRWAEVSSVNFIDPDMLTLRDQSFVAGETVIAPAVYHRGCIALNPAEVGRRSFVGNGAILTGSCTMAENSLLGLHSVPSTSTIEAGSTWLGSPAVRLPRRQASQAFPEDLTFRPARRLVAWRLGIEAIRLCLPWTILDLATLLDVELAVRTAETLPPAGLIALMPLLTTGVGIACYLSVVALKWLVVGRYRERVEPMWGLFVRRTELITGLYSMLAAPMLTGLFTGTPWVVPFLRLLGTRIGRRVWLTTIWFSEFDLVELGDDSSMGEDAALQTHLFEDRVMKMSRVRIGAGCSLGAVSVVLYDAEVGDGACVDAQTLVMKAEILPPRTRWRGIPARAVSQVVVGRPEVSEGPLDEVA